MRSGLGLPLSVGHPPHGEDGHNDQRNRNGQREDRDFQPMQWADFPKTDAQKRTEAEEHRCPVVGVEGRPAMFRPVPFLAVDASAFKESDRELVPAQKDRIDASQSQERTAPHVREKTERRRDAEEGSLH